MALQVMYVDCWADPIDKLKPFVEVNDLIMITGLVSTKDVYQLEERVKRQLQSVSDVMCCCVGPFLVLVNQARLRVSEYELQFVDYRPVLRIRADYDQHKVSFFLIQVQSHEKHRPGLLSWGFQDRERFMNKLLEAMTAEKVEQWPDSVMAGSQFFCGEMGTADLLKRYKTIQHVGNGRLFCLSTNDSLNSTPGLDQRNLETLSVSFPAIVSRQPLKKEDASYQSCANHEDDKESVDECSVDWEDGDSGDSAESSAHQSSMSQDAVFAKPDKSSPASRVPDGCAYDHAARCWYTRERWLDWYNDDCEYQASCGISSQVDECLNELLVAEGADAGIAHGVALLTNFLIHKMQLNTNADTGRAIHEAMYEPMFYRAHYLTEQGWPQNTILTREQGESVMAKWRNNFIDKEGEPRRNAFWAHVDRRAGSTILAKLVINLGPADAGCFSVAVADMMTAKLSKQHVASVQANKEAYESHSNLIRARVKVLKCRYKRAIKLFKMQNRPGHRLTLTKQN